jgi:hypothetical protein
MFAILGDKEGFAKAVRLVAADVHFDRDIDVSVFETNIRIMGGLLSAHLLADNPQLALMDDYNGELLTLAMDLGDRLLPAFDTPSKIPVHMINLRNGMPKRKTPSTCTAAAGTLALEFGLLSKITGNTAYEHAANEAVRALWKRRSPLNLVGNNINTNSGKWENLNSGIGAGIDSFYEYLLKVYIMFGDAEWLEMFNVSYQAVTEHCMHGDWHFEVNMNKGKSAVASQKVSALQAFWPSLQVLAGDVEGANRTYKAFQTLWRKFSVMPEMFDFSTNDVVPYAKDYPLRPEFIESTYHMYQATKSEHYLEVGKEILYTLQNRTKVCPSPPSCFFIATQ